MKNIILVRHGKSSWDYEVSDKDRPLLQRGIKDGHLVANEFKNRMVAVDAVFSSPANRALHTCMIFMRILKYPFNKLQVVHNLYDFSGDAVVQFVEELPDHLNTVMIFGHNEAFTHIANSWGNMHIDNVPTSGLVHIEFNEDKWADVASGITKRVIVPKQLK